MYGGGSEFTELFGGIARVLKSSSIRMVSGGNITVDASEELSSSSTIILTSGDSILLSINLAFSCAQTSESNNKELLFLMGA